MEKESTIDDKMSTTAPYENHEEKTKAAWGENEVKLDSKEEENATPTWKDFTEATTLHGLKYVFQPSFRFRR